LGESSNCDDSPARSGPAVTPCAELPLQPVELALPAVLMTTSHRPVDYDDPTLASEVILFAVLLLRLLDRVEVRQAVE
jgi:hypothetical protein